MSQVTRNIPLSLVKSEESVFFSARNLQDIKYTALFNRVMLTFEQVEHLKSVIDEQSMLLQRLLSVFEKR